MSSNKDNSKEKVEGEKVVIEKAAANNDNKDEEKTDLVSDEPYWKLKKVQIIRRMRMNSMRFSCTSAKSLFNCIPEILFFRIAVGRR